MKKNPSAKAIPSTVQKLKKLTMHNDVRIDPYFWLKDKSNPEVIKHLKNENKYAEKLLAPTKKLAKSIFSEMKKRIKESDESVPVSLGKFSYKTKTLKGKEYVQHIFIDNKTKKETVVLDENKLSRGHKYFDLTGPEVSFDGKFVLYGIDTNGAELYDLKIRDRETLKDLPLTIEKTCGDFEWGKRGEIYYLMPDKKQRPSKLYRLDPHSKKKAELIFEDKDDQYWVSLNISMTEDFLFVNCGAIETTEVWYLDLNDPKAKLKLFSKRKKGIEYTLDHVKLMNKDYFVVNTNEKALDYKIDLYDLKTKKTKAFIPHRKGVMIEDFLVLKDALLLETRSLARTEVEMIDWKTKKTTQLKFKEEVREVGLSEQNIHYEADTLRLNYSSLVTPHSVIEYSFKTKKMKLLKSQVVVGYDAKKYTCERIMAKSHDGTEIPVSLVYKKGLKKDGMNPCFLYGYGSYGAPTTTSFSSRMLPLMERGFVFAIAHVRGSSDCGKDWYYQGKFLKKQNTFLDFIAVTEHLIQKKYTRPELVSAMGGSAGGMLMGAIANLRPDLYLTITASVPFVDVLTTMLDDTLMLTKIEYDEWGNPNDKKYYQYMKSYSPYDNVEHKEYPYMIVRAGLNDPRVTYWEPAKWVLKLRDFKKDDRPVLFKVNMGAGHFGNTGRYQALVEYAEEFAYILARTSESLKNLKKQKNVKR